MRVWGRGVGWQMEGEGRRIWRRGGEVGVGLQDAKNSKCLVGILQPDRNSFPVI